MDEATREQMGKNGRKYFMEHFRMDYQTERLISILEQRIS
jgi:hypothetical protein